MSFPYASETPPSLTPYQLQYGGYKFGSGQPFALKKIDGLDLPSVRSGDAGRPRDQGMFIGLDVLGQREVTVQGDLRTDGVSLGHALQELRKAMTIGGVVEKPLYINYPAVGTICAMARVRKRQIPVDIPFVLGGLATNVAVLFVMTDPHWYGQTTTTTIVSQAPASSLAFPLAFPFGFGGGAYWGSATVTNSGDVETRPRLIIEGPCHNPVIWNTSVEGEPTLACDIEIPAGGRLVLDTDLRTALYYEPGSTVPLAPSTVLRAGSEWWVLEPGANGIGFSSGTSEATGQVSIESAPTYLL